MIPAEIEALLALPESARAKLADIAGPGWLCVNYGGTPEAEARAELGTTGRLLGGVNEHGRTWAWCPASTFAIVQACGGAPGLRERDSGYGYEAKVGAPYLVVNAATPRLAALRLLAAVSK